MTRELRDFNRDRWTALRNVMEDTGLTPGAKNVFTALVTRFAGRDTGRARVRDADVAAAVAMKPDTIYRFLRELVDKGYLIALERVRGGGLYCCAALSPGAASPLEGTEKPGSASDLSASRADTDDAKTDVHPGKSDAHPSPPRPPYEDYQVQSKSARERPAPHLLARVELGSDEQAAWDRWTCSLGLPPLADLAAMHRDGAAWPTTRTPPTDRASFEWTLAERVIRWAADRTPTKQGGRDDRAA